MKKKLLVFTLCFTLIFSSLNLKKSYADGGIISAPMLATIATVATATGIVLKSDSDILELGKMFYEKNKNRWDEMNRAFNTTVFVASSGLVTIGKKFLDETMDFLDMIKVSSDGSFGTVDKIGDLTVGAST